MPAFVKTPMVDAGFNLDVMGEVSYLEKSLNKQLMGLIDPLEIANVCMFLLSAASSTITGREIAVDNCYRG